MVSLKLGSGIGDMNGGMEGGFGVGGMVGGAGGLVIGGLGGRVVGLVGGRVEGLTWGLFETVFLWPLPKLRQTLRIKSMWLITSVYTLAYLHCRFVKLAIPIWTKRFEFLKGSKAPRGPPESPLHRLLFQFPAQNWLPTILAPIYWRQICAGCRRMFRVLSASLSVPFSVVPQPVPVSIWILSIYFFQLEFTKMQMGLMFSSKKKCSFCVENWSYIIKPTSVNHSQNGDVVP